LAHSLRRLEQGENDGDGELAVVRSRAIGGAHVLAALWERLGVRTQLQELLQEREFDSDIERVLFALVANRCLEPSSKLGCCEWVAGDAAIPGLEALQPQQAYRAMDFLLDNAEAVQQRVFYSVARLLQLEVDLIFFDTTSSYFEMEGEDEEGIRHFGYSRDQRPDRAQVVVGLAVTKEGIPVRCWVFPGNTADASTVQQVKQDLHGWKLDRVVLVADRGMTGEENLRLLRQDGGHYIMGERMRAGLPLVEEALSRPGRYRVVRDNLEVKEVVVKSGRRSDRYVICRNPWEAERDRARRELLLADLEGALGELDQAQGVHRRKACALRISRRFGRYVRQLRNGNLELDRAVVAAEERLDGKYLIHTSDRTLTAEEVALGYRQLLQVERGWRDLKQRLELRPMFHRKEDRIRAHILLCFLGLMLIRVAENQADTTWARLRRELQRVCQVELSGPAGTVLQTSRLTPSQTQLFDALQVPPPLRVWAAASSSAPEAA
jgi:hypothetical protein